MCVGIFPRLCCGCCRFMSCELWLWIAVCGKISAISLRLLPDHVMCIGFGIAGKFRDFVVAVAVVWADGEFWGTHS